MKLLSFIGIAAFSISFSLSPIEVEAAIYNFVTESGHVNMTTNAPNGYLNAGDKGTIDTSPAGNQIYDSASGTLAPLTRIRFTYDLSRPASQEAYFYITPFINNQHTSYPTVIPSDFSAPSVIARSEEESLYRTVLRQLTETRFVLSIANLSSSNALNFASGIALFGDFFSYGAIDTRYRVAATTTPLPAAFPLFGLGLAGMIGYRRLRKTS